MAARVGLPPGLDFQEVLADELLLIVPCGHRLAELDDISLADIGRHPVLMPDRHSSTRHIIEEAFAQAGLELQVTMELERWQVVKEFVALGQGFALVLGFSLGEDRGRFAVRLVRQSFPSLSYGIITRLSEPGHPLPHRGRPRPALLGAQTAALKFLLRPSVQRQMR